MSNLVLLFSVFVPTILHTATTDFTCNGDICSCTTGHCIHTCLSNECMNQYFICPSSATSCILNCFGQESCTNMQLYGASDTVILNCKGTNSCDQTQLFCGQPNAFPNNYLSKTYSKDEFNGDITDCFVNLLTPNAMSFGTITCDGSITNCIIDAYEINSISQSLFQCKISDTIGNGCELNCLETSSTTSHCNSIEFKCDPLSECSCGKDTNCNNPNVYLTQHEFNINNINKRSNEYNCIDLLRTEVRIKSAVRSNRKDGFSKETSFNYEISGKDKTHNTLLYRYKNEWEELSDELYDIHYSVYFIEHEENGEIYNFEWSFNEPNVICWLTNELYAFKIDLYYDKNVSFAFTYLYSEDMKLTSTNSEQLTARNLWNKELTSLEVGYIYFDYEYNITLYNPETISPTIIPTNTPTSMPTNNPSNIIIIESETTDITSNTHTNEIVSTTEVNEREVIETTNSNNIVNNLNVKSNNNNDNTAVKGLLFAIALLGGLCICFTVICIIFLKQRKKQKEGMEAEYASAAGGGDSLSEHNEADIDSTDHDHDLNNIKIVNNENKKRAPSQSSLIKKYIKRDPSNIINNNNNESESGIGYIANNKQISEDSNSENDSIGNENEISIDDEYNHVITHQPEISIMHEDQILNRGMINDENSVSISEINNNNNNISNISNINIHKKQIESVTLTYNNEPNVNNIFNNNYNQKINDTTLGFEPVSMLNHYVNQDSTFNTYNKMVSDEREVSMSMSEMSQSQSHTRSRKSQSLNIEPIELKEDIDIVKTKTKTKTNIGSAVKSMKIFSEKIAKAAVTFGHNNCNEMDEMDEMDDSNDNDDNDELDYATMVIYQNKNSSKIPDSQIETSRRAPAVISVDKINAKFLTMKSTQTMIVKNIESSNDDDDEYDESYSSDNDNNRDPIDVSEESDIIQMKRHMKNLSNVSNKSHHDRRTMIINDDLTINHLVNSIDED